MPGEQELMEALQVMEAQPMEVQPMEAPPLNFNHVTNIDDVFSFIMKGIKEAPTNGNRNNFVHTVASDCNRFAVSENDALNFLMQYQESDFTGSEIKQAVRSAYQRTNEHGTKHFEAHVSRQNHTSNTTQVSTSTDPKTSEFSYIRCGCDYFKVGYVSDRFIKKKRVLMPWKRAEITLDYGTSFLQTIPKYDSFAMVPDNKNYDPIVKNCYNLYSKFPHEPAAGSCEYSKQMIKHIFGEQFDQGIKYMQCLYQKPTQSLPILALVSATRETGKTTYLNWLQAIFSDNMTVIQSSDLESSFNGIYANKNIIAIDETLIERSAAAERLKNISTAKRLTVNNKYVAPYSVDFYGKIILCSNKENALIRIDEEEVRYWIRKVSKPAQDIPDFEKLLINEIPAFLKFLNDQEPLQIKSRMMFLPDEIETDQLLAVKSDSLSTLAKEIMIRLTYFFENDGNSLESCFCTPKDLKDKYFQFEHNIGAAYIGTVIKHEFKLMPADKVTRYRPFADELAKTGRPFQFTRELFTETKQNENVTTCNF